jgi:hypothetical protein
VGTTNFYWVVPPERFYSFRPTLVKNINHYVVAVPIRLSSDSPGSEDVAEQAAETTDVSPEEIEQLSASMQGDVLRDEPEAPPQVRPVTRSMSHKAATG